MPTELAQLWDYSSGVCLYEDITYGQWGTILWSPDEIVDNQIWKTTRFFNAEDFREGDLIIGEFRGDSDLAVIIRCAQDEPDFGSIVIAMSLDRREDWPIAASTIDIFFEKMIAAVGEMYWEPGFKFDEDLIEKWLSGDV